MCLSPIRAEKQDFGKPKLDPEGSLILPCGKCYECKSKRAIEWATRCSHEISLHKENCFITLTYDDENLPSKLIVKSYFQKFIKRLRKFTKTKLKYIVSHEYGGKTGRPHHHAIIFGWSPKNQEYLQMAPSGEPLYTSQDLNKLWKFGYHSIGEANEKTAYYIASYSLKSSTHFINNTDTGEIIKVTDSMDCSKRPAIGAEYFIKHAKRIVHSNVQLPRYYAKLLERHYPDLLEQYENESMMRNNTVRTPHHIYAKFVITEQKEQTENGLRSNTDDKRISKIYKSQLKTNRDMAVNYSKKEIL